MENFVLKISEKLCPVSLFRTRYVALIYIGEIKYPITQNILTEPGIDKSWKDRRVTVSGARRSRCVQMASSIRLSSDGAREKSYF